MNATHPVRAPRRLLMRGAWLLLGTWLAYLAVGNAFLNLDAAQSLVNRRPEAFRMTWAGGHTWWPGRVSLREVRMQGQVRRTRWSAEAERLHGRIALWALLDRQLHVPWARAAGVRGEVARVEPGDERPLASTPSRSAAWRMRVDRIASDSVLGGSVFGWRLEGSGEAEAGFSKQFRGGPMELFPSHLRFEAAQVERDGLRWLDDTRLDARLAMAAHLPAEHPGLARLALLRGELSLQARTVALQAELDEQGSYRFSALPGEGWIEASLALDDGALRAGDRMQLHAPLRFVDADGTAYDSALDASLDVDAGLHLRARLPEQPGQQTWLDADLSVPGTALPLADARARLQRASGHARGRWHVPSLGGVLRLFARADWLDLEGKGTVEADLRLAVGRLADGSRLGARGVEARARVLGNRFSGRASADAVIEAREDGPSRSRVSLAMDRFEAGPDGAGAIAWVRGSDLRLDLESDAVLERMRETLQARLRFRNAQVPDLAAFNPYLPNDGLRFVHGSGRLDGDLRVDGEGEVGSGELRVDARRARLSVAGLQLDGDVTIDGRLRRGSLQRGLFAVDGTRVQLRNAAFRERGGQARAGWWATVELPRGQVAWHQPATVGGQLRARMKDVDFLLAMFADRGHYPAWIGRLVDAGEATLDGHWQWRGDTLVLDRMRAANARFQVDGRLRLQGERRHGDLYAKWGVLGMGMELRGGRPRLHLRGARAWYDGRPDLLR